MARPFLLRTRWLIGHVLIALIVALFLYCMTWQVHRLDQRKDRNVETRQAMSAPPLLTIPPVGTQDWRSITLTGTWDPGETQLLRYPLRNGRSGYDLVTPLVLANGDRILVDRGWIPIETGKKLTRATSAPMGETTVDLWFRTARAGDPKPGTNGTDLPTVTKITGAYAQIQPGKPSGDITVDGSTTTPLTLEGPDLSEGSHFSYALQWFSFALIGIFGWSALLWKAWRDERT